MAEKITPHKKPFTPRQATTTMLFALVACFAFTAYQSTLFPVVVTWEGHRYFLLSELFRPENLRAAIFFENFDFFKTPLYPISLRAAFVVFGETPEAVVHLHLLFRFLGIFLLAACVQRLAGTWAAVVSIVLLALSPVLLTYQHTLLAESSSMFAFSLIAAALVNFILRPTLARCLLVTLCLIISFYFRPSFAYHPLIVAVVVLLLPFGRVLGHRSHLKFRIAVPYAALIIFLSFAGMYPWKTLSLKSDDFAQSNSASLPATGYLTLNAVQNSGDIFGFLSKTFDTLSFSLGGRAVESENALFSNIVLSGASPRVLFPGPLGWESFGSSNLSRISGRSHLQRFELGLFRLSKSTRLTRLFHAFTVALLAIGLLRRDMALFVMPFLALSLYLLHAATLFAIDRYAVPAVALEFVCFVVFSVRALRWFTRPVVNEKAHPVREKDARSREAIVRSRKSDQILLELEAELERINKEAGLPSEEQKTFVA